MWPSTAFTHFSLCRENITLNGLTLISIQNRPTKRAFGTKATMWATTFRSVRSKSNYTQSRVQLSVTAKTIFCSLWNEVGKELNRVPKLTGCIKKHWEKGDVPAPEDCRHLFCIYAYSTDGMQKDQSFSRCKSIQRFAYAEDLLHGLCLILPGDTLGSNQIVLHIWFWVYSWREML